MRPSAFCSAACSLAGSFHVTSTTLAFSFSHANGVASRPSVTTMMGFIGSSSKRNDDTGFLIAGGTSRDVSRRLFDPQPQHIRVITPRPVGGAFLGLVQEPGAKQLIIPRIDWRIELQVRRQRRSRIQLVP